uniref:Uncharacterized protein n=1 Tax=Oryza punctata TaxID=4537 RepID=A0A0E0MP15_ORYPU
MVAGGGKRRRPPFREAAGRERRRWWRPGGGPTSWIQREGKGGNAVVSRWRWPGIPVAPPSEFL